MQKKTSCDSSWLRYGVSSSRVWWTMPLTSGEQDSKLVIKQMVIISNSACDVCETIFHTIQQPVLFRSTQQLALPEENS